MRAMARIAVSCQRAAAARSPSCSARQARLLYVSAVPWPRSTRAFLGSISDDRGVQPRTRLVEVALTARQLAEPDQAARGVPELADALRGVDPPLDVGARGLDLTGHRARPAEHDQQPGGLVGADAFDGVPVGLLDRRHRLGVPAPHQRDLGARPPGCCPSPSGRRPRGTRRTRRSRPPRPGRSPHG